MTVATQLTIGRLFLAPLFVYFLLQETVDSLWTASRNRIQSRGDSRNLFSTFSSPTVTPARSATSAMRLAVSSAFSHILE